ncbi:hypothetical protein QNI16_09905 [Cytophagaceae bacterium YF14B1]|uniref:Uncharacterized protein n=1 Tax=Xanthocytophaga flava TaxID=3048013 RepID=A0AAE3QKV8_9BACT|nr:hypothetical protein [Xanthocytophaga flavus]MDJ1480795.1 hypothetical protein [Xanthocytophaga flavus]
MINHFQLACGRMYEHFIHCAFADKPHQLQNYNPGRMMELIVVEDWKEDRELFDKLLTIIKSDTENAWDELSGNYSYTMRHHNVDMPDTDLLILDGESRDTAVLFLQEQWVYLRSQIGQASCCNDIIQIILLGLTLVCAEQKLNEDSK